MGLPIAARLAPETAFDVSWPMTRPSASSESVPINHPRSSRSDFFHSAVLFEMADQILVFGKC
ncbi:conserved hypothetical protein [Ricinus communis]|uniref:Uncharacterized protein n=1 Tax=Ricinus communis TaxID=3988 RepID=B9SMF6_RICCO|nr:conserved hypothetical protein [Ricinus communis]